METKNLYVQHTATKFTIESQWLISSQIDVTPYYQQVETITEHVMKLQKFTQHCLSQVPSKDNDNLKSTLDYSKLQIASANNKIKNLQDKLDHLKLLIEKPANYRMKRSLLPFLGTLLGSITGVATESDVKKINEHLRYLETQDRALSHVVQDSITVVNATRFKMHNVVDHVNSLIEAMKVLHNIVLNTTSDTYNRLNEIEFNIHCYDHLHSILTILFRNIDALEQSIKDFESLISNVLKNEVTMQVVSPTKLKRLLYSVSKGISKDLALPYHFENNLLDYYRTLSCELTHGDHGPMLVIGIPLRSSHSRYDIFHVLSFPVPYKNASVLTIDVKNPFIALSYDKTKVVYMQEHEYLLCSKPNDIICHLSSPIRFTSQVQNECSVSLLLTNSIKKCPVRLSPPSLMLPQIRLLKNDIWIVITNTTQVFTIICPHDAPSMVSINPPLGKLYVQTGCKAQSQQVAIPPTYVTSTLIKLMPVSEFIDYNITIYDTMVGPKIANFMSKFPERLSPILDQTIDIAELSHRIDDHLKQNFRYHPYGSHYYYIWTPIIVLVTLLITILIYLSIKYNFNLFPCLGTRRRTKESTPELNASKLDILSQSPPVIFGESETSLP